MNQIPFKSYNLENAIMSWEFPGTEGLINAPILWNGDAITAYSIDDSIVITNQTQILKRMKLGNGEIRYLAYVYVVPVRFDKNKSEYLAVLVQVRAIRDCYMLLIFDPRGQLFYQEVLRKTKRTPNPMQRIINTADGQEALVVDVDSRIVYKAIQKNVRIKIKHLADS